MTPLLPQFKFNDRSDAGHEVSSSEQAGRARQLASSPGCLWQMNQQSTPAVSTMLG